MAATVKEEKDEVRNITGNRPAPDRTPLATDEGQRQERAKALQQESIKEAPKGKALGKKKKLEIAEDPRRYYEGSKYQKKIEQLNEKISATEDKAEKAKIQKELNELNEDVEEQQEQSATTTTTLGGSPTQGATMAMPDKNKK